MAIAHVRKGDTVVVVAGKERGKRGQGAARDPGEGSRAWSSAST